MEIQEDSNQGFNFTKFVEDSKNALLNPKEYFANMSTTGGLTNPIIKVLIYGSIIGIFAFLWSTAGLRFASGPAWLGGGLGVMAFFGSIIGTMIGLFIGAVIMLVISSIFSGNTDFEANIHVVAALSVISVISSAFSFFDGVNLYLSAIVSISISLWGIWMTYQALVHTLKASESGVKILMIVLAVLIVIFSFVGIAAKKTMQHFSAKYGLENLENMTKKEREAAVFKSIEKITKGKVKADELKKEQDMLSMIEMADGTVINNPNIKTIKSSFNKINMDNDFIILNTSAGFIQAAICDDGNFNVQYNNALNQYEASETLNKELVIKIFIKYHNHDEEFKDFCEWEDFE